MGTAHDEKKSENVRMKMQEGFLWGGATAANQCEGSASAGPSAFCPAGFGRIG